MYNWSLLLVDCFGQIPGVHLDNGGICMRKGIRSGKKQFITVILCMMILGLFTGFPWQSVSVQAAVKPRLNKQSICLVKGETEKLKLNEKKANVTWKSTKKSVASVDKNGRVRAKKKGTATIRAKYNGKTCQCKVRVEAPKISKAEIRLQTGQSSQIRLKGTAQKVSWNSSEPEIVSVDKSGKITAKKAGNAVIEGKIRKNSYSCKVTVTEVVDTSGNTVPQPDAVSGTDNTPNTETPSQPENPEQKPDDTTVQPENPEQKEDGAAEQPEEKPDAVTMSVNDIVSTSYGIVYAIQNTKKFDVTVCKGCVLEKKTDSGWEEISQEEREWEKDWSLKAGKKQTGFQYINYSNDENLGFEPGDYRITKTVKAAREELKLTAEFTCVQAVMRVSATPEGSCRVPMSQEKFDIRVQNDSNTYVAVCQWIMLEKETEGVWTEFETIKGSTHIDDEIDIEPGSSAVFTAWLGRDPVYGIPCQPGKYRAVVKYSMRGQRAVTYVYFNIVE